MSLFQSLFPAHPEAGTEILPSEGPLPPFEGATGWLNSEPLRPEGLRGRVLAVQFSGRTRASTGSGRCPTCVSGLPSTRIKA